tara:strand:- start:3619 stop:4728 length:1110 start_codon:yes stop_codon:yes gene_type:complete
MKIKKILQNIFKKIFQNLFKLIYGRIKLLDNKSEFNFKKYNIEKINISGQVYTVNKNIYEIDNGRVFTDLVEHVAIIKDNFILSKISYQQIKGELKETSYNKVLSNGTNRMKKKIKGRVLSLLQGASGNNYFHFMFDIVPKILLLEKMNLLKQIDFYLVPNVENWQKKILSNFGILEKQLLDSNKFRHIEAEKIYALDHPWYTRGIIQDEIANIPNWIILSLREKFLDCSKKFPITDKIFIDRSDSIYNHCKLINNKEIIDYLAKNDFKSYQISKLDFSEQIHLFKNAKIIIGPHGAAFTNIIFSNPGLKIVELIPRTHSSIKCEKFSNLLNFNYTRVNLDLIEDLDKNEIGDMKISILNLEEILKKIL